MSSQRPEGAETDVGNPGTNGLSELDRKIPGLEGLGGGDYLDQTACSPRSHRTSLRISSQERNFLLQRRGGEVGSFGSIA
jgi:hypothetical protein